MLRCKHCKKKIYFIISSGVKNLYNSLLGSKLYIFERKLHQAFYPKGEGERGKGKKRV
jgi:hypothetical protein